MRAEHSHIVFALRGNIKVEKEEMRGRYTCVEPALLTGDQVQVNDESTACDDSTTDIEEQVVLLPSKMVISVSSSDVLQMSLTKGCLEVLTNLGKVSPWSKLQALVYDILPSTTAVFSYATGSRKLSTNEQFFVGAQTAVSLLQTIRIKQGVSFIAANKVYTSTNKTTIV